MLHVCPPDREQRNPNPTSFLSADSAGEALSFARCLLFSMEHCEWQVPWRELKGKQRKERREKRILGKQDERLGQVPGCHLAKYVGQPSFAYKSASNLQISVAGSQQNCQSPGTAIFWSPFPWWSFPSSTQLNPAHEGQWLLLVLPKVAFLQRTTGGGYLSHADSLYLARFPQHPKSWMYIVVFNKTLEIPQ